MHVILACAPENSWFSSDLEFLSRMSPCTGRQFISRILLLAGNFTSWGRASAHEGYKCIVQTTHVDVPEFSSRAIRMQRELQSQMSYKHHVLAWDLNTQYCTRMKEYLGHPRVYCIESAAIKRQLPGITYAPWLGANGYGSNVRAWAWDQADSVYLAWFGNHTLSCDLFWFMEYDIDWTGKALDLFQRLDQTAPHLDYVCPHPKNFTSAFLLDPTMANRSIAISVWNKIHKRTAGEPRHTIGCLIQLVRVKAKLLSTALEFAQNPRSNMYCEMRLASLCSAASWCRLGDFFDPQWGVARFFASFGWQGNVTVPWSNKTLFWHPAKPAPVPSLTRKAHG